jgi:hypothetical protein
MLGSASASTATAASVPIDLFILASSSACQAD